MQAETDIAALLLLTRFPLLLQNEKLVIDEFLEKVAAASRKVSCCAFDCKPLWTLRFHLDVFAVYL